MEGDRLTGERLELAVTTADAPPALGTISRWGFHRGNHAAMVSHLRDGTRADVLVYGLLAGELSS